MLFEIWFLVPLPKGPLEAALGHRPRPSAGGPDKLEALTSLIYGFGVLADPMNILYMLIGLFLGVLIGVLPGLGGANGVAILLPLTFGMEPTSAIIMLSCIYWGALFGGAITSILFNIPGEPWSVATTFDGYPMAQAGRAGEALTAAFTSSFVGALSRSRDHLPRPLSRQFALQFGPAEFFAVQFLTFCSFIGMGREPPAKILSAMMLGFALAAVGLDSVTGELRLTFGSTELLRGFDFLVAVIGLFGIGEILLTMEEGLASRARSEARHGRRPAHLGELPRFWRPTCAAPSSAAGWASPPAAPRPASFMSYGLAKRFARDQPRFGRARSRAWSRPRPPPMPPAPAALLPMLTLGIPGSPTAAVLLGGLLIWGLQPGPAAVHRAEGLRLGPDRQHVSGQRRRASSSCSSTVPLFAAILRIPFSIIAPVILVACAVGAYTVHNALFDIGPDAGVRRRRLPVQEARLPAGALVLALVLGDLAESSFRQAMLISQGSVAIFWSNPLVGSIMRLGCSCCSGR